MAKKCSLCKKQVPIKGNAIDECKDCGELWDDHCDHVVCPTRENSGCNCNSVFGSCFYCGTTMKGIPCIFELPEEPFYAIEEFMNIYKLGKRDAKEGKKQPKFIRRKEKDDIRNLMWVEYMRGYRSVKQPSVKRAE